MTFKNKFNKFKQYNEYFNGLNDTQITEMLDNAAGKIGSMQDLSKDTKDICGEAVHSVKQSVKLGLNLKNLNVKKLKKAFDELKDISKSEISDDEKQTVDLMIGLTDLFIDNYSSMRNW